MIPSLKLLVLVRPIFTQGTVDVEDDSLRGCWPESLQYDSSFSYQFSNSRLLWGQKWSRTPAKLSAPTLEQNLPQQADKQDIEKRMVSRLPS